MEWGFLLFENSGVPGAGDLDSGEELQTLGLTNLIAVFMTTSVLYVFGFSFPYRKLTKMFYSFQNLRFL